MYKLFVLFLILINITLCLPQAIHAQSKSTNYEFKDYTFGNGGNESSTPNYGLFGVLGNSTEGNSTSTTFNIDQGLNYTAMALVPPAPTVSNPATNYDRLLVVVNIGNNATDATYALAISNDNFATDTRYIKSDNTVGSSLTINDFLPYSTGGSNWGGASGFYVTGLASNITYSVKVKARQGDFTETEYGPVAQVATSDVSLTFGASASTITFNSLNPSNSYTDATQSTVLTTSTNAYNGYTIYAKVDTPLTAGSQTIANYSGTNTAPTTWAGSGFGYTTNDSVLGQGTADRFTSGGPKYAGFQTAAADPVADHTAVIQNPTVSGEQFTVSYRVTAPSSAVAGNYQNTITYIVVPVY